MLAMKNTLTDEMIIERALDCIKKAERKGIILRLLGAIAVQLHCPQHSHILKSLKRHVTDIDFVAYKKDENKILNLFLKDMNFQLLSKPGVTPGLYSNRLIFSINEYEDLHIDIFLDILYMCHLIDFRNKLEIDRPTIPLAELFLEKTQIVKINEKDIIDVIAILLEHEYGEDDLDKINLRRVSDMLCNDWGFYYTVTLNLRKILEYSNTCKALNNNEKSIVENKINYLLNYLHQKPKTPKWKLRAILGPRIKWYNEVEEVNRSPF